MLPKFKWPRLRHTHPGYFTIASGLLYVHVALAFDNIFLSPRRHSVSAFAIQRDVAPLWIWGVLHIITGVMIVVGLYGNFKWARMGFLLSVSTFAATGVALACAAFVYSDATIQATIVYFYLSMAAFAALREPEVNPAFHKSGAG